MEKQRYDEEDQLNMINLMISDSSIFTVLKSILRPEYFDKKFQVAIDYLLDYTSSYSTLPTVEQLNNESRCNFRIVDGVVGSLGIRQSIIDLVEGFCKKRALEIAINNCYDKLQKGDTTSLDKIIKDAQMISIEKDLGINFWDNTAEYLHKLDTEMGVIPSGWKQFDDYFNGGFSWGQLNYVCSPSGGGKSLVMANLALNWSLMGYNVVYLTLELDRELVAKRIVAMQSNTRYRDISANIEGTAQKIALAKLNNKPGVLQIMDVPKGATTNDIEAYIQSYEIATKIIPEIIIVDYASILSPSDRRIDPNNIHLRDKAIAEELREMARNRTHNGKKTTVISASQITKDASSEMEFSMSNIAGGSTLIHTCDNLFTVRTNPEMRARGEYEFKILKSRNSGATDKKFRLKFDVDTLLISDMTEDSSTPTNNGSNMSGALQTLQMLKSN